MQAPALLFTTLKKLLCKLTNNHYRELFHYKFDAFLNLFIPSVYLKFQFSLFPEIITREYKRILTMWSLLL